MINLYWKPADDDVDWEGIVSDVARVQEIVVANVHHERLVDPVSAQMPETTIENIRLQLFVNP